jgi:hypothetical protein
MHHAVRIAATASHFKSRLSEGFSLVEKYIPEIPLIM